MTVGYLVTLTCPMCGSEIEHVASGADPARGRAVAQCTSCRVPVRIEVWVSVAHRRARRLPEPDLAIPALVSHPSLER